MGKQETSAGRHWPSREKAAAGAEEPTRPSLLLRLFLGRWGIGSSLSPGSKEGRHLQFHRSIVQSSLTRGSRHLLLRNRGGQRSELRRDPEDVGNRPPMGLGVGLSSRPTFGAIKDCPQWSTSCRGPELPHLRPLDSYVHSKQITSYHFQHC